MAKITTYKETRIKFPIFLSNRSVYRYTKYTRNNYVYKQLEKNQIVFKIAPSIEIFGKLEHVPNNYMSGALHRI